MVGAFIGWGVLNWLVGADNPGVAVWLLITLMMLGAMIGSGFLGVAIERFAYRPLRTAPRIAPLISALGVSFFLQNAVLLLLGANIRSYDTSTFVPFSTGVHIGDVDIWLMRILAIVLALVLMGVLWWIVRRTRLGRSMRAVAVDREAAQMMGIDVDRTIVAAFFIASVLAGVGGVMVGLVFSRVFHLMGFLAGLKAFTAAVVGGIGSIPGAMLGGLLVGLAESFSAAYVSSTFQNLIVFGLLIAVMLFRPTGLLGSPEIGKV
jgi:branched-chain amino acid transport system permease protein